MDKYINDGGLEYLISLIQGKLSGDDKEFKIVELQSSNQIPTAYSPVTMVNSVSWSNFHVPTVRSVSGATSPPNWNISNNSLEISYDRDAASTSKGLEDSINFKSRSGSSFTANFVIKAINYPSSVTNNTAYIPQIATAQFDLDTTPYDAILLLKSNAYSCGVTNITDNRITCAVINFSGYVRATFLCMKLRESKNPGTPLTLSQYNELLQSGNLQDKYYAVIDD